jgi:SAM-dependent methyltransferase
MPDLRWNTATWDGGYDWSQRGEEWSGAWGSSEAEWFTCILPRIHRALPARQTLEIAPGYGRWSRFLIPVSERYIGVDLSGECIQACEETFAGVKNARFVKNDGRSLDMVEDGSCDFVFSFDSLVHVEMDIIDDYVRGIARKLSRGGVAFLHHSNLSHVEDKTPYASHQRAASVGYDLVRDAISASGGRTLVQELVDWGSTACIDCFTLFGRSADFPEVETALIENPQLMMSAALASRFMGAYCSLPKRG